MLFLLLAQLNSKHRTLNVGFGFVIQINSCLAPKSRLIRVRIFGEETCFEIFVGVHDEDYYREINLSPSQAWQSYQFEEYRYPESMPPLAAYDIELNHLKRTHYGLNVSLDLGQFMQQHRLKWANLYLGLTAV